MSSLDLFVRYARQRLRIALFAPLAAALAVTGSLLQAAHPISYGDVRTSAFEVFFLVLAFRIWDDLADHNWDRANHPGRVMTSSGSTAQFAAFGFLFLAPGLALLLSQPDGLSRIVTVGAAAATAACWYLSRTPSGARAPGSYLVLTKYPAFTYAAIPGHLPSVNDMWPRGLSILTAVYVAICIYETIMDPALRRSFNGASLQ